MAKVIKNLNPEKNKQTLDLKVNLAEQPTVECPECKHTYFRQVFAIKRVSKMITGNPKDSPVPIMVFKCDSCGFVLEEFVPKIV